MEYMNEQEERGRMGCPPTIPALTPMSSLPSMTISKEPALRLKPNRVAAATTKILFTRRDFFLWEGVEYRQERLMSSLGELPLVVPLCSSSQPQSDLCAHMCELCQESKLHEGT